MVFVFDRQRVIPFFRAVQKNPRLHSATTFQRIITRSETMADE
jgi:hypothetical protein